MPLQQPLQAALLTSALALLAQPAHAALPIQSWTAPSGAKVMFMQAEALPMVDIRVDLPAGGRADPQGKEGLAAAVADLIGRGAQGLNENQIADGFADTGAQFSGGAGNDSAGFSLRTLTSEPEFSKSVALFKTVLQKPVFSADILARENARALASLKESLTKPDTLASRAFSQALYPQHSYGALVTEASLKAITLADVEQFYKTRYLAKHAVVSMVGNIGRAQAEQLAAELTANLPQGTLQGDPLGGQNYPELQAAMQGQTIQIDHPAAQSHILMGLPAMRRGAPDYFDLLVANHVLGGGGFNSRLMDEIREKRGLAYSAYSYFMPAGDAGPFQAGVQTQKSQTAEALGLMRKTIEDFIAKGPTEAELKAAKANLIGGFPLRIDSNSKLVSNISMMGLHNMPLDYLDTWTREIEKVTVDSARKAFAKHVNPNKLVTVVVGGAVDSPTPAKP
ncbi:M16 family metallopeptidase [Limnobacter sp.]|uniref:M16 family metallopeptidase n=1 Tax=Limnobacter sp. TaxID=2003368 RepID=UPI003511C63E